MTPIGATPVNATLEFELGGEAHELKLADLSVEFTTWAYAPTLVEVSAGLVEHIITDLQQEEEERMSTTKSIKDQLQEMWDNAEEGSFDGSDAIIVKHGEDFEIRTQAGYNSLGAVPNIRVLERAEKPEPRLRAVMASYIHDGYNVRQVFTDMGEGDWESLDYSATADELVDPVELVELPGREDLCAALLGASDLDGTWPGTVPLADAVLELLEGK